VIALDDPYGNLITNISAEEFRKLGYSAGETIRVRIGERTIEVPFVRTFSDVPLMKPLLYLDSRGRLGMAVNQGNFAAIYGVQPPQPIFIPNPGK